MASKKSTTASPAEPLQVALLRGINVTGKRMVPMAQLRRIAEALGFTQAQTYLQSGNLVFHAAKSKRQVIEAKLEAALSAEFGFEVPVVVRTAAEWQLLSKGMPFAEAARERPEKVLLALAKLPLKPGCDTQIQAYAKAGEQVALMEQGLWIDFSPNGSGRSKITPAVLDRLAGSSVTTRNLRTVQALASLLEPVQN